MVGAPGRGAGGARSRARVLARRRPGRPAGGGAARRLSTSLRGLLPLLLVLGLTTAAAPAATARASAPQPPPAGARVDYQLGGAYRPADGVRVVVRDRTDRPARGRYSICYVNGFQTQPGELGWWRRHHPGLLLRDAGGALVADPEWPDEVLLDVSTAGRRAAVARIVGRWTRGCARDGFAAVEHDNLDSWTRSRGLLTRDDAVRTARLLTRAAHRHGLAAAQKNAPELAPLSRRTGFDLAIAEECEVYRECDRYRRAFGRQVIEVEYTDNGRRAFRRACAKRGDSSSVVLRDRDLVPRGRAGHVARWC